MKNYLLLCVLCALSLAAFGQNKASLIGTWKFKDLMNETKKQFDDETYKEAMKGFNSLAYKFLANGDYISVSNNNSEMANWTYDGKSKTITIKSKKENPYTLKIVEFSKKEMRVNFAESLFLIFEKVNSFDKIENLEKKLIANKMADEKIKDKLNLTDTKVLGTWTFVDLTKEAKQELGEAMATITMSLTKGMEVKLNKDKTFSSRMLKKNQEGKWHLEKEINAVIMTDKDAQSNFLKIYELNEKRMVAALNGKVKSIFMRKEFAAKGKENTAKKNAQIRNQIMLLQSKLKQLNIKDVALEDLANLSAEELKEQLKLIKLKEEIIKLKEKM